MTEKLIRDGQVAVLISPGYGAGWSTWNYEPGVTNILMFDRRIVEAVEANKTDEEIVTLVTSIFAPEDPPYTGGVSNLHIVWVPQGTEFVINEYDGSESIKYKDHDHWIKA